MGPSDDGADPQTRSKGRPLDPSLVIDLAALSARKVKPTPFIIWLTGANYDILRLNISEEKKYRVLGSLVLATGLLAFFASFYGLRGDESVLRSLGISLILGLSVMVIDRSLVAFPLNPPRIPEDALASLAEPLSGTGDAARFQRLATSRFGSHPVLAIPMNLFRMLPRMLVAICLSLILAEAVLLLRFEEDIDRRAAAVLDQTSKATIARLTETYIAETAGYDKQIALLLVGPQGQDPEDVRKDIDALTIEINALQSDAVIYRSLQLSQADPNAPALCLPLSDVTIICSTAHTELQNAVSDAALYRTLAQVEADPPSVGVQEYYTFSDGHQEHSSGISGEEKNYSIFLGQAAAKDGEANDLRVANDLAAANLGGQAAAKDTAAGLKFNQIADKTNYLNDLLNVIEQNRASKSDEIAFLEGQKAEAADKYSGRVEKEREQASGEKQPPLLLRILALELLARDPDPSTFDVDSDKPGIQEEAGASCPDNGSFGSRFCQLKHWFVPPTPLGSQVAAWRYFFLLFDMMPLIGKFVLSSRRFRPHDEMEQILAAYTRMRALSALEVEANLIGVGLEGRAAGRRGSRAVAGAGYLSEKRRRERRFWRKKEPKPPKVPENPFSLSDEPAV